MRVFRLGIVIATFVLGWGGAAAQDATALVYGEPASFDVSAQSTSASFTFEGAEGDTVFLALTPQNPELAAEIRVFSPGGALIAESNDFLFGGIIGPLALDSTGRYTVAAGRPEWNETDGTLELLVDLMEDRVVEMGDSTILSFEAPGALAALRLTAEAETVVRYQLYCGACGTVMFLPSGEPFVVNGVYDDVALPLLRLPEAGEYLVLVQSFEVQEDLEAIIDTPEIIPLTSNEPAVTEVSDSEPAYFSFESQVDKVWQLNAEMPEGGRWMEIHYLEDREFWDTVVGVDYGTGPNGAPRVSPFVAPEDGAYYVVAFFEDWEDLDVAREMTMTLSPESSVAVDAGNAVYGVAFARDRRSDLPV